MILTVMNKNKIVFILFIFVISIVFLGCKESFIVEKEWHVKKREYIPYDSVMFPVVELEVIRKVKIGDSLEQIKEKVGFKPVKYYIHPGYALLSTKIDGKSYEVAFQYNEQDIVVDISFKKTK